MDLKLRSGKMLENAGPIEMLRGTCSPQGLRKQSPMDDANELPDSWHCCDERGGWPGTHRKNPWQPYKEMCPGKSY